jgi:hypothetical protein
LEEAKNLTTEDNYLQDQDNMNFIRKKDHQHHVMFLVVIRG